LVAGEGFECAVEDLFSGVFNAFFKIVEGHGFGKGFVERVDLGGELVDQVLALFGTEFWHGLRYFIPRLVRCTRKGKVNPGSSRAFGLDPLTQKLPPARFQARSFLAHRHALQVLCPVLPSFGARGPQAILPAKCMVRIKKVPVFEQEALG
jgi:hypothetical protein